MMRSLFIFLTIFGLLVAPKSHADDAKKEDLKKEEVKQEEKPDPALCRALPVYQPSADVEYKPGVDVRGKPVVSADLNAGALSSIPSKINIPLTVSLAKILNLDTTQYPYNQLGTGTEAQVGMITVEDNRVTLNDKPLSGEQQSNLAVLCSKNTP